MTTTRTMTRSQAAALIAGQPTPCQQELLDALVDEGVIQNDPEPRPDWNDMTVPQMVDWINERTDGDMETWRNFELHIQKFATAIADRLNLDPAVKGAPE